jgi:hypothetical protein
MPESSASPNAIPPCCDEEQRCEAFRLSSALLVRVLCGASTSARTVSRSRSPLRQNRPHCPTGHLLATFHTAGHAMRLADYSEPQRRRHRHAESAVGNRQGPGSGLRKSAIEDNSAHDRTQTSCRRSGPRYVDRPGDEVRYRASEEDWATVATAPSTDARSKNETGRPAGWRSFQPSKIGTSAIVWSWRSPHHLKKGTR